MTMNYPLKTDDGRYLVFLSGKWTDSSSSTTYQNINPADRSVSFGEVTECTQTEVDAAVKAADAAFPVWRAVSGNIKTKMFLQVAQVLYESYDRIVQTISAEMGKSVFDARLDLDEAIGVIEAVAPQGLSLKGETYQKNIDGVVMESRPEPRGVAAIITPFNFPVAIPLAQITAALVTGNTVVWKPSHLIPESSQAIIAAIETARDWVERRYAVKIPDGYLNMVSGDVAAGQALVTHPIYKALSFTGSKAVGDAVDALASKLGKRVMKEVGGINFFYVHSDADIHRAARNFVYGKTITAGQRCTSIQEVLVDRPVYEVFLAAVVQEAANIVAGDGRSEAVANADATAGQFGLTPLVSEEQQQRVLSLIDQSVKQGATILFQKQIDPALATKGNFVPFTIMGDVGPANVLASTEIFGPVGVLTAVDGLGAAIKKINETIGIVACIDSKNKDASETFIQNVLRTRVDDGRHGTGAFWATKFGGDRGAGSGNPALDEGMAYGYVLWKTIYRSYKEMA
jgi:acyl-CoA reductase-like NAD-dependent aldehyde dehydrogenase